MYFQQQSAVDIASAGHNLLILGQAGTGKSFVVRKIQEMLTKNSKTVKITCSTGIACCVYNDACTVNRFLGLHDGRYSADEINKIHAENSKFNYVDDNLKNTDCLIVDECSMVSEKAFETILSVCSRKKEQLQLIFCGDFLQLPPVANARYSDYGNYCFQSIKFLKVFPHQIVLTQNVRTKEEPLIKTISEVFSGNINPETSTFISSLNRPLPPGQNTVKLFSLNSHVDDYNRKCLLKFPGDVYEYISTDSGDISQLDHIQAPHSLWLKVGCPVILLQNLSDKLVNGLRGHVHAFDGGPVIKFETLNLVTKIPLVKFSVFSPSMGSDIAIREQYPLKLAFGLTIHKAQGMTLDRVEIDCRDIFRQGQLGVALSRASTSSGLRVINFHPRYIMKPAKTVTDFMSLDSGDILDDLTCCRDKKGIADTEGVCTGHSDVTETETTSTESVPELQSVLIEESYQEEDDEGSENLEMDDEFDKVLESIVTDEGRTCDFTIPEGLMETIEKNLIIEKELTSSHNKMKEIASKLDDTRLQLFVKKILLKMNEFTKSICDTDDPITKGIPESKLNKFYQLVHEYNTGPEYKLNCIILFETEDDLSDEHLITCYKVLESIRLFCIEKKVELIQKETSRIQRRFVTSSSKARIRYVAGYCVSKLRQKYVKKQKSNLFSKSKESQNSYAEAKCKVSILNLLREEEHFLKETTCEPESLLDIENRQGITRGLTNVTDSMYSFFLSLTEIALNFLIHENLLVYGKEMFTKCIENIYKDKKLTENFSNIIKSKLSSEQFEEFDEIEENTDIGFQEIQINSIFRELTEKYVSVLLAQFRKDVKSACKIEKKMAHRKQIKISSKKKSADLKSEEASHVSMPKKRKSKSRTDTASVIQSGTTEPQASTSSQPEQQASTSSQSEPQASTSQPETQASTSFQPELQASSSPQPVLDDEMCKKCFLDKDDEWIQCDSCNGWFHRKCAGLKNVRQWKKYNKEGVEWLCHECK
ncbi:uncharacterized protein LOC123535080 [Mercenaria mercenaria]|uniref:uncharacterized protein LOC123535080 n=1 Tax=Mercenaria mercenaria TaxID=6596 RepID=UPI00234F4F41|nr:uncharacterized protein LOC123535080 [Mercenaria mercenaria]